MAEAVEGTTSLYTHQDCLQCAEPLAYEVLVLYLSMNSRVSTRKMQFKQNSSIPRLQQCQVSVPERPLLLAGNPECSKFEKAALRPVR